LDPVEIISKVAGKIAPGRAPSFAKAHVLKALEEISHQKSVGRLKLSKDLQLGGGEIRTLVKHLKIEKLIDVSNSGISLSSNGRKLLSQLAAFISEPILVSSTPLTVGSVNVAVQVRAMKDFVEYGLEQRDAAKMAGAKGATTLIFSGNKLTMPGTREDVLKNNQAVLTSLAKLHLNEGDVIIIGSADEKTKAELGARTAALELLKASTQDDQEHVLSDRKVKTHKRVR